MRDYLLWFVDPDTKKPISARKFIADWDTDTIAHALGIAQSIDLGTLCNIPKDAFIERLRIELVARNL